MPQQAKRSLQKEQKKQNQRRVTYLLGQKSSVPYTRCVQMTLSRVIDKMVVDEGRALQPCRYRLFTHMSCIILYPYST